MRRFGLALAWCALTVAVSSAAAQPADPTEGKRLAEAWCSQCHVVGGGATTGPDVGPPFAALANDPEKTEDTLRGFLQHPQRPMPPLELSRRDIDQLVAYIRSLASQ